MNRLIAIGYNDVTGKLFALYSLLSQKNESGTIFPATTSFVHIFPIFQVPLFVDMMSANMSLTQHFVLPLLLSDRGMNYIVGKDWRDLFDVVIVQADKPGFFNDRRK